MMNYISEYYENIVYVKRIIVSYMGNYLIRNQREEDLRENHPYFDTPLFAVGRESQFRKLCQVIVYSRYDTSHKDPITGKERKIKYKRLQ